MDTAAADDALARLSRGEISAPMALGQLLLAWRNLSALRGWLLSRSEPVAAALLALLDTHRAGTEQALLILERAVSAEGEADGLDRCRRLFDEAVTLNPAASVALYSLGDPALLDAATDEAVLLMDRVGLLAPDRHLLDLGCGIGRFEVALAGRVASVTGLDISPAMIAAARQRCAGLANVRLAVTEGRDLAPFGRATLDGVIAVDSFPYLYEVGGPAFARAQLSEIARVLRPGGRALILNLSYRGDPDSDRRDAHDFAAELGLELRRDGTADLRSWDGLSFLFARPA